MSYEAYRTMCIQNNLMDGATNSQFMKVFDRLAINTTAEMGENIKLALTVAIWTCSTEKTLPDVREIIEQYI